RSPVTSDLAGDKFARDGVVLLIDWKADQVSLRDVEHDRELWKHRCHTCFAGELSADGSRLAALGLGGIEVWDAAADRVLFAEGTGVVGYEGSVSLSPDGRLVAWTERAAVHVREVDSGREATLRLDGSASRVGFGPGSGQLAVITTSSLSLWDPAAGRA